MPTLFFADLVRELCQDGGTGQLAPSGAAPGHRSFADAVPAATPFYYTIAGIALPDQWEVGQGHIDAEGRLVRDAVAASSAGGAAVDFTPGLKTIALVAAAEWFAARDAAELALGDAVAGLSDALAVKQPLSTMHAAVAAGAESDLVTLRRDAGWVNLPLSALLFRGADGSYQAASPLLAVAGSAGAPSLSFAGDTNTGLFRANADTLGFAVGGAERLRLWPSGLLTLTLAPATNGGIRVEKTASPGPASIRWEFNHRPNDLDLLLYGYDGTVFRNMLFADWAAAELKLGTNNFPLVAGTNYVRPGTDNAYPMGQPAARWSTLYAGSGTINTSDAREKAWRGAPTDAELQAARRIAAEIGFFQWHAACAAKGDAARLHCGVRAQAVWTIMAEEGLVEPIASGIEPDSRYAFLCWDEWDDGPAGDPAIDTAPARLAGDRFGVRPDQLALFLIAAQEARIAAIEAAP